MPDNQSDKPKRKPNNVPKCGAKLRKKDRHCTQDAGRRTNHYGVGRCWLHGGLTPIKTGLYSKVVRAERKQMVDDLLALPIEDLLSLKREIACVKAAIDEVCEVTYGVKVAVGDPNAPPSLAGIDVLTDVNRLVLLVDLFDKCSKIIERYEKIEESRSSRYTDGLIQGFLRGLYGLVITKRYDFSKPDHIAAFGKDLAALDPSGGFVPALPERRSAD